jgi:hypothetical protein
MKKTQKLMAVLVLVGFMGSTALPIIAEASPYHHDREEQRIEHQREEHRIAEHRREEHRIAEHRREEHRIAEHRREEHRRHDNRAEYRRHHDHESHSDTGNLVTGLLIGGVIGTIVGNN